MKIKNMLAAMAVAAILTVPAYAAASAPPDPEMLPPPIVSDGPAVEYGGFADVPSGHWASGFIGRACWEGWVGTPGLDMFDPDGPVTYADFCGAVCRAVYLEPGTDFSYESTLPSWYRAVSLAAEHGVLSGTAMAGEDDWDVSVMASVDRGSMAVMLSNALRDAGVIDPNTGRGASGGEFDRMDPAVVSAVLDCMDAGLISGYPDGTFGADGLMTRSQLAKVVCMLHDACVPSSGS